LTYILDLYILSILSERKNVITTNSRSDHNDADLSSILEVYIMFVNWFHNMFYYILDIYSVDVHIITAVCIIANLSYLIALT